MSAPDNAITIKEEAKRYWRHPSPSVLAMEIKCEGCSWEGQFGELLCDSNTNNDTTWCPQCKTAAWIWK